MKKKKATLSGGLRAASPNAAHLAVGEDPDTLVLSGGAAFQKNSRRTNKAMVSFSASEISRGSGRTPLGLQRQVAKDKKRDTSFLVLTKPRIKNAESEGCF